MEANVFEKKIRDPYNIINNTSMAKRKYGAISKRRKGTFKKSYKKRRTFRSKRRRGIYSLPLAGFPKSKVVRLRYCEEITLDPTATTQGVFVFSANGVYDPNVTGIGHQPKGFDQNMAFYNHYTVLGSKISLRYCNKTGGNDVPGYAELLLTDDGTTGASLIAPIDMYESRYSKRGIPTTYGTERGYIGQRNTLTRKFSAKKFFRSRAVTSDANLRGTAVSNPTDQAYYEFVLFPINDNNPGVMVFFVTIEYIVLLAEPNDIPRS